MTLERLSPEERAAFLLHDVFDLGFDDIANALNKSSAAARKLASRARAKIRAEKPQSAIKPKLDDPLITAFFKTVQSGDVVGFADLLTEDAVLYSDGGGKKSAALNPIYGRKNILAFFAGLLRKNPMPKADAIQLVNVNGTPGLLLEAEPDSPEIWTFNWTDTGKITDLYIIRNPEKLGHVKI
jgi:RNA polymerase sigma-70 factor (ECF subfamily)